MHDNLQALNNGLGLYLEGKLSLQEIEDKLTTPILIDDAFEDLADNIGSIIFELDMWGINQPLTDDDIQQFRSELTAYLQKNQP